jgi:hypothetical protein
MKTTSKRIHNKNGASKARRTVPMTHGSVITQQATAGDGSTAQNEGPLSSQLLSKMHAYWRAANYLSVGQIYQ